ncbi:MAG: PhoX family protein [Alphaproteobacteria bacterium]
MIDDDKPTHRPLGPTIAQVINARIGRRPVLIGLAASAAAVLAGCDRRPSPALVRLGFSEVNHRRLAEGIEVAAGYEAKTLLRWGDPVLAGAEPFKAGKSTAGAQARQFGYNCDFLAFMPLPRGAANPKRGLLCVNHEYTNAELMLPGIANRHAAWAKGGAAQIALEMAAHGHSVVEIEKVDNAWRPAANRARNRRLTATTPMRLSGPAAGHARLRTKASPDGRTARGTLNNCSGGVTPWGTVLIAEENFHYYFGGRPKKSAFYASERANFQRYGIRGRPFYGWYRHDKRFDVEIEPNEMNRFGWIVEFDPYDPRSVPVKRTALGRFKHEGAAVALNHDGRVVVYSGDDQVFEYVYKFVSERRFDPDDRAANRDLLDSGTLYAARFDADGTLTWLPLVHGQGPLTPDNGFAGQADVLIETRRAADLMGATAMDRPEGIAVNPASGRVYVALTKGKQRGKRRPVNAGNPRERNRAGHIIEIVPPGAVGATDHAADKGRWEFFLFAGDPQNSKPRAGANPGVSKAGWLVNPDNLSFDPSGRLWITTDQGPDQSRRQIADGVYATQIAGPNRALTRLFFTVPVGAEPCSPCFTPDGKTMFVSVQHPGEGSGFDAPSTRWPDFKASVPPRPSVVAITKKDGGSIGG